MSTPEPRIRLITRGDDAGSSRSANRAIREAFETGILRNVSVMAPGPAAWDAMEVLGHVPGLCVGMHVALNCEWDIPRWGPVLPPARVPSLVDDQGHLLRTPQDLHDRQASVAEMMAEVEAQLALLRRIGFTISYMDQHMGVGWLPGLGAALTDLARREGLIDADRLFPHLPGLPKDQPSGNDYGSDLVARLRSAPDGTWVALGHPCYDDAELQGFSGMESTPGEIARDRDLQRRMFTEPSVIEACQTLGVEPIRYSDGVNKR